MKPDSWSMFAAPTGRIREVAECAVCVPVSGPTMNFTLFLMPGSSSITDSDRPPKSCSPESNHDPGSSVSLNVVSITLIGRLASSFLMSSPEMMSVPVRSMPFMSTPAGSISSRLLRSAVPGRSEIGRSGIASWGTVIGGAVSASEIGNMPAMGIAPRSDVKAIATPRRTRRRLVRNNLVAKGRIGGVPFRGMARGLELGG